MKIFCTLGLIVAVAFLAAEGHDMGKCISEEKFNAYASQPQGCQDLAGTPTDDNRSDSQGSQESQESTEHERDCFTRQGGFVDPATNATDVEKFKTALKGVAIDDDKVEEMNDALVACNEGKADTIEKEKSMEVFECFMKKLHKLCKDKSHSKPDKD